MYEHQYFVYTLSNPLNTILYIGVPNNLLRRIQEHKHKLKKSFTKKYNCTKLVYLEKSNSIHSAIEKEKQLKNWHRKWKFNLIKAENPEFIDLSYDFDFDFSTQPDPEINSG